MRNEKLNRIFSSRAFYIMFSILVSIALWMYVEISQNQEQTIRVDNVPVVMLNDAVLRDKGFVITSRSSDTVTLTFVCNRSVAAKLNNTTLSVTIDLANITTTGYSSQRPQIVYPAGVTANSMTSVSRSVDSIQLYVDKLFEKTVLVDGVYNGGTASDEFIAEAPQFFPDTITVYGPESEVSKIDRAWVPIVRGNLSATYTEELDFVLHDINGDEIKSESLEPSQDKIRVTVPVKVVKDVPLTVDFMHGAGSTAQNTKVTINPSKITVSGDPEAMKDFNSVTLGTIDLTKIDLAAAEMFAIVIPNNFVNLSGETEAFVSVELLGLEMKHISVTNLQHVNVPRGFTASIKTQSIDVKIRGKAEDLINVTAANIRVIADLTDYSAGTTSVPVKVFIDGDVGDVGAVDEYKITVTVSRE